MSEWKSVSEIMKNHKIGDQVDVLFARPSWSWPILGIVTNVGDSLLWAAYDQQNDKYHAWESEEPTIYWEVPRLPPQPNPIKQEKEYRY